MTDEETQPMSPTPDSYPEQLLEELVEQSTDRQWWALHTKPRQEKSLARELFLQKIPYYLPLVKSTNCYGNRRVTSHKPLFPSYMFLFGTEQERVESLKTNRVVQNLQVYDQELLERNLKHLRQLILSGAPLTVENQLGSGNRVRIKSGSMIGLEGVIIKRHGETRLLVSVDFLQKGASVAIEDFQVEPIT